MSIGCQFVLLVAGLVALTTALPQQPANPIIGVVSTPNVDCFAFVTPPADIKDRVVGCTETYFVKWLEASGARVVNYPWNITGAARDELLSSVNGLLFPGGGLDGSALNEYVSNAEYVVDYALDRNAKGDAFFVWGTCQGFQVIAAATSRNVSVITTGQFPGMYPLMMALNFTRNQPDSKLFGFASMRRNPDLLDVLANKPTTLNWHHSAVTDESTKYSPRFAENFNVLSTNADPQTGAVFYSAYEHKTANIFAVQFHPERPPFEFSNDRIGHDLDTIEVSQYLTRFIVQRLRMNNHSFTGGATQAAKYMIEKTGRLVDYGYGETVYWFVQ